MSMQIAGLRAAGFTHRRLTAILARWRRVPERTGARAPDPAASYWFDTSGRYVAQGQAVLDRLAGLAQTVWGIGLGGALGQLSDTDRLASWPDTFQAIHETRNVLLRMYAEVGAQRATWLDRHGDATSEEAAYHRTCDVITMAAWLTVLEEVALVEYVGQIVAAGRTPPPLVLGLLAWLDDDDEDPPAALSAPPAPHGGRVEQPRDAADLEELRRTIARRRRFAQGVHALALAERRVTAGNA
jgi:hypothetical protein